MSNSFDLDSVLQQRWDSVSQTIRRAEEDYPAKLVDVLFADNVTHPWYDKCHEFLQQHPGEVAVRGQLPDHYEFLFFPKSGRGFWFRYREKLESIGIISPASAERVQALIAEKKLL